MMPLSPALYVAAASALVRRVNQLDPFARQPRWLVNPLNSSRESAAFVNHIGYWSHCPLGGTSLWPFPLDADCNDMACIADRHGALRMGAPQHGMIHVTWSAGERRFIRAGIVVSAKELPPAGGQQRPESRYPLKAR
jgi:hypothetical protein